MIPHLYRLNTGDIFSVNLKTFAKNPNLRDNPHIQIIKIVKIRPKWFIYIFGHYFNIPKPYKIWVVQIMSI